MNEFLLEARGELKRLEHIIYVSLKYTRTTDVLINAIKRMISTYDFIIMAFLERAQEEEKITSVPKSPALRGKRVAELYPQDPQIQKNLYFYSFLRTILTMPYAKREEYRRHVTFIVELSESTVEVDIDILTNCEKFIHRFLHYSRVVLDDLTEQEKEDEI